MAKDKKFDLNNRSTVLLTTGLLVAVALVSVLFFNPGGLISRPDEGKHKKVSIPEISRTYGEATDVSKPKQRQNLPRNFEAPFQPPDISGLLDRIPTELPSLTPPVMAPPATRKPVVDEKSLATYTKHAEMLARARGWLSSGFEADRVASAPVGGESKFSSAYVLLNSGESMERLDLMSLVRNESMRTVKTAKDALNALVEESADVNILEQKDDYLIYDIAGTRGYQVGKISIDDNSVHISGYVNLTTSRMPDFLKKDWIEKLRTL